MNQCDVLHSAVSFNSAETQFSHCDDMDNSSHMRLLLVCQLHFVERQVAEWMI